MRGITLTTMTALRRYDSFRGIEPLAEMWTLTKDARTAVCTLTTNPLGWQVTITLNGELYRSQVCKIEADVFDTSAAWRKDWEAKGWAG